MSLVALFAYRRTLRIDFFMVPEQQHCFLGVNAIIASPAMRRCLELVKCVARTSASVLISGETGTGKEIVARAVHHYSLRASKPWVDVNCAALPESLIESELFGHERGAFSGADASRPGLFELAHTGTLFLDEIGELEPRMQVKLLRVLDGTPFYRVGGRRKVEVDTRIVAATNQRLDEMVASGRFRSDLFHRLNQCAVRIPPLRERREDILALAEHFLMQYDPLAKLAEDARASLLAYNWPGNVRELRNVVISALVQRRDLTIGGNELRGLVPRSTPAAMQGSRPAPAVAPRGGVWLTDLERGAIVEALKQTGGHCQHAADLLGISRRTLSRKLKQYGRFVEEQAQAGDGVRL
jgi:transcriptional regulator with PAS, ATPase and Fis domain